MIKLHTLRAWTLMVAAKRKRSGEEYNEDDKLKHQVICRGDADRPNTLVLKTHSHQHQR